MTLPGQSCAGTLAYGDMQEAAQHELSLRFFQKVPASPSRCGSMPSCQVDSWVLVPCRVKNVCMGSVARWGCGTNQAACSPRDREVQQRVHNTQRPSLFPVMSAMHMSTKETCREV